jgi:hypothetical protein
MFRDLKIGAAVIGFLQQAAFDTAKGAIVPRTE